MKTLAIVLVSLCVFAHATSVFQAPVFLQMKTSAFGNAIGSMIEMNMATENPSGRLNAIQELLNQVEENLDEQDASALEDITNKRGICSTGQAELNGLIDSLRTYIASLLQEQSDLQNEELEKNQQVTENTELLAQTNDQLTNTQNELQAENESFSLRDNEYAEAIAACEQALTILDTLTVGDVIGFVQMKAKFTGVASLLAKHVSKSVSVFIQPIVTVLTDLSNSTQEVDQEQLGQVVELIQDLLVQLRQQKIDNEVQHTSNVERLEGLISNLEQTIRDLEGLIESLVSRLGEIATRLVNIEDLLVSNYANLELQENNLRELEDKCNGYEVEYESAQNLRNGQHDLLERIQEYFSNQVVPAVQNVRDESYEDEITAP